MRRNITFWLSPIILSLNIFSCISFSTFQSAQTVEEGKFVLAGGAVGFVEEGDSGLFPEVGLRYGLSDRSDFGLKLTPPLIFFGDIKYELIQSPITVSFDLGISIFPGETHRSTAIYPMLIAGKDNWYVGLKEIYLKYEGSAELWDTIEYEGSQWFPPIIVIGGVFGDKFRLLPELNIYMPRGDEKVGFMPGLGLEIQF